VGIQYRHRDMSSLTGGHGAGACGCSAGLPGAGEREIHVHDGVRYVGLEPWNTACARAHEDLFARIRPDLPRLTEWINARFNATVYEDPYSPFCLIAETTATLKSSMPTWMTTAGCTPPDRGAQ